MDGTPACDKPAHCWLLASNTSKIWLSPFFQCRGAECGVKLLSLLYTSSAQLSRTLNQLFHKKALTYSFVSEKCLVK